MTNADLSKVEGESGDDFAGAIATRRCFAFGAEIAADFHRTDYGRVLSGNWSMRALLKCDVVWGCLYWKRQ